MSYVHVTVQCRVQCIYLLVLRYAITGAWCRVEFELRRVESESPLCGMIGPRNGQFFLRDAYSVSPN